MRAVAIYRCPCILKSSLRRAFLSFVFEQSIMREIGEEKHGKAADDCR